MSKIEVYNQLEKKTIFSIWLDLLCSCVISMLKRLTILKYISDYLLNSLICNVSINISKILPQFTIILNLIHASTEETLFSYNYHKNKNVYFEKNKIILYRQCNWFSSNFLNKASEFLESMKNCFLGTT